MDKVKNKVVIWSVDDFNTLGLMRELGNYNLDIEFLIKGKRGVAVESKFCQKYKETDSIEEGLEYLKHLTNNGNKIIVIVSSDEIITYLDLHRDELDDNYILPLTSQKGELSKFTDKNSMTQLAESLGIICPESIKVKYDSSIDTINYPCLIKPSHEKPGHYNEFKFKICKSKRELEKILRLCRKESEFIIQKYIPKECDALVYGGRMRDGETVIAGVLIRDRLSLSGSSSHGKITNNIPNCIDTDKIKLFLKKIDYYGLFSFEYGIYNDKAYFFEVNLRNDGTSHLFYQAGANIPLAYVFSCSDLDYRSISTKVTDDTWFIDEIYDIENIFRCHISIKRWIREKSQATIYRFYDKQDINPWKFEKKHSFKQIMRDIVLYLFRPYVVFVLDKLHIKK